jgi:hypothetical protein
MSRIAESCGSCLKEQSFGFIVFFTVLGIEPMALHMLGIYNWAILPCPKG